MQGALHVVHWNILHRFYSEIQYLASEELLRQLLLLQVCQRTRFFWIGMGRHDFLDCIALHCSALRCVALCCIALHPVHNMHICVCVYIYIHIHLCLSL